MSRPWFTLSFCAAYTVLFTWDRPLGIYYPLIKHWSFGAAGPDAGPGMHWYGFMAGAAMIATLVSLVCRDRWIPKSWQSLLWAVPVLAMLCCGLQLLHFFKPVG